MASLSWCWLFLRLTGLGAGTPVETALVFTPYVAAASVVAVGLVALLGVRPAVWSAAGGAVGLVLVVLPLFRAGSQPADGADGPRLRMMTVNARYGEADAAAMVALVRDHDLDIVGVQEVTPDLIARLVAAGIDELLPHQELVPDDDAAGMALYANRPFDAVDDQVEGMVPSVTARFAFDRTRPLEVTVIHPLPPLGGWRSDWTQTLASLPRPDAATTRIVMGDFNATLDQPSFQAVLDHGYLDAAHVVGRGWVPTWGVGGAPLLAIDHVLVDRTVLVEAVSVHDVEGSDHRAVIATVRLSTIG